MLNLTDFVLSDHENVDANSFASMGADLLKCKILYLIFSDNMLTCSDDNCYSDAESGFPEVSYTPIQSPSPHFRNMSGAVMSTGRKILFQVSDWGVDFPSAWAPELANSWRVANDIYPSVIAFGSYSTIARILNQVVPQTDFAGPGQWLDLDMLEIGNNVFTNYEEQTHFSLWCIIKSPLIIGAALRDNHTTISRASLAILKHPSVISYNQDSLGVAASFRRRWTEAGYEIWAGPLSGERTVAAIINLFDKPQKLTLDLPDIGLQSAGIVKDIWNNVSSNNVLTSYSAMVGPHGTLLLELQGTTAAGLYNSTFASTTGYILTGSSLQKQFNIVVAQPQPITQSTA
jgi:alpha-galactosidase